MCALEIPIQYDEIKRGMVEQAMTSHSGGHGLDTPRTGRYALVKRVSNRAAGLCPLRPSSSARRSRLLASGSTKLFPIQREVFMSRALSFAAVFLGMAMAASNSTGGAPAKSQHQAIKRTDPNSIAAHEQLLAKAKQGRIDVYFEGDSITRRWGATDYPRFLAQWKRHFYGRNAANFGWGGDTTQNILWRLQNGELDGVSPKVIVLQAGTNNLPCDRTCRQSKGQ